MGVLAVDAGVDQRPVRLSDCRYLAYMTVGGCWVVVDTSEVWARWTDNAERFGRRMVVQSAHV